MNSKLSFFYLSWYLDIHITHESSLPSNFHLFFFLEFNGFPKNIIALHLKKIYFVLIVFLFCIPIDIQFQPFATIFVILRLFFLCLDFWGGVITFSVLYYFGSGFFTLPLFIQALSVLILSSLLCFKFWCRSITCRWSHTKVFYKKSIPKNFAKLSWKDLCQSFFLKKLLAGGK